MRKFLGDAEYWNKVDATAEKYAERTRLTNIFAAAIAALVISGEFAMLVRFIGAYIAFNTLNYLLIMYAVRQQD